MDTAEEELYWLTLRRIKGCSDAILRSMQVASTQPWQILNAGDDAWRRAGASNDLLNELHRWQRLPGKHPAQLEAQADQRILTGLGAETIPLGSAQYPGLLAEIHDPPPLLFVMGNPAYLQQPLLAVVGSRKASAVGLRAARELSRALVGCGLGISSGLALGIDGAAHRAALDAGGVTAAVLATGLDVCYPRRHLELLQQIVRSGVVVSEFPPGTQPLRDRFPRRNRLISGLSLGVLIVEAAVRSGSLITARLALEQNREVFALPHSIYHPQGRGCHLLIGQGAKLVQNVEDILEELPVLVPVTPTAADNNAAGPLEMPMLPAYCVPVLAALGYEPLSVDDLIALTGQDPAQVLRALVELEFAGKACNSGGRYMRC